MTEKFTGIVLDVTRHTDRHDVVTVFTRARGRVVFLSPSGTGRAGRMRNARLLPLSVIDGEMTFKPTVELQKLGAVTLNTVWRDIYFNPVKQMLAMFLSEFLNRLLRATMPDTELWDYIFGSLRLLDGMERGLGDFHIVFLASLLPFAGIQPDIRDYRPGCYFDFQAGRFTAAMPPHRDWVRGDGAAAVVTLLRINYRNARMLRLDRDARGRLLDGLLRYYAVHYPGTGSLKSLDVLKELYR